MKKVLCAYEGCSNRRIHFESDKKRPQQTVEVPDDFEGKAYCSIECACYAGAYSVRAKNKDNGV
jgi:hypothetical protein